MPDVFNVTIVPQFTVSNGTISFVAIEWGCTITNLYVPSKNGEKVDILLGFDTLEGWKKGTEAHNAIVGRFANRIRGAKPGSPDYVSKEEFASHLQEKQDNVDKTIAKNEAMEKKFFDEEMQEHKNEVPIV